jgi:branched-subunit amino acid transport protein AzlD
MTLRGSLWTWALTVVAAVVVVAALFFRDRNVWTGLGLLAGSAVFLLVVRFVANAFRD